MLAPVDVSRQTYPFTLPELPYAYDALEPHIDRTTLELHHQQTSRDLREEAQRGAREADAAAQDRRWRSCCARRTNYPMNWVRP